MKTLIAVAAVLVIVAAVAIGLLVKKSSDDQAAKEAAERSSSVAASSASAKASAAAASASAKAAAAKAARDLERKQRRYIVKQLQISITKDARESVNDGILEGPIKFTSCTAVGGGSTDILLDKTGQFDCLAVNEVDSAEGTQSGYQYSATVNWSDASYTWHLGD